MSAVDRSEVSVLNADGLAAWVAQLEAAIERALRDVVATLPFEPGEHGIGPPASAAELAALRRQMPSVPGELLHLHRHVGPISLPDIGNGYFLGSVDDLTAGLADNGRPDRIGQPFPQHTDIVVFGSNGGGDLYAIVVRTGRVLRIRHAEYLDGVYRGTTSGVTEAGDDLYDFLERLLVATTAFADDGRIADL